MMDDILKLFSVFIEDLDPAEEIVKCYYHFGILMATTKMFNENIRYIYNCYYRDGKIIKESVMANLEILDCAN